METAFESSHSRKLDRRHAYILKFAHESQFVDRKSKRVKPAKLSQTISAFCNADGGSIIIGVEDDHKWDGFAVPEEANGIEQLIHELYPMILPIGVQYFGAEGEPGLVLFLDIPKTSEIVRASDGKVYIRRGASNQPVSTPDQIKRLEMNKGISSYEDATVQDEAQNIIESEVYATFNAEIVPNAEKEPWLRKQRLSWPHSRQF